jgi:hypothetical protein
LANVTTASQIFVLNIASALCFSPYCLFFLSFVLSYHPLLVRVFPLSLLCHGLLVGAAAVVLLVDAADVKNVIASETDEDRFKSKNKVYVPRKNIIFVSSVRWQQGAAHAQIAKEPEGGCPNGHRLIS